MQPTTDEQMLLLPSLKSIFAWAYGTVCVCRHWHPSHAPHTHSLNFNLINWFRLVNFHLFPESEFVWQRSCRRHRWSKQQQVVRRVCFGCSYHRLHEVCLHSRIIWWESVNNENFVVSLPRRHLNSSVPLHLFFSWTATCHICREPAKHYEQQNSKMDLVAKALINVWLLQNWAVRPRSFRR